MRVTVTQKAALMKRMKEDEEAQEKERLRIEEQQIKIQAWKKKIWLGFCKDVMAMDERFTIYPYGDFKRKHTNDSIDDTTLSEVCLRREGTLCDVFVVLGQRMGFSVYAGDRTVFVKIAARPSKGFVMPVIELSDELETQFVDGVERERKNLKFGKKQYRGPMSGVLQF